jgi:protein arginine N-methyltransferase 2
MAWEQLVRFYPYVLLFSYSSHAQFSDTLFYDVYTRLSDLHLADVGVDVEWSDVDIMQGDEDRWGETKRYFTVPIYRLPTCKMRAV